MEDLGECNIRAIKVLRESIRDVVLPPWEPLGVFLDACFEEEDGMVACRLDLNLCLDAGSGSSPMISRKLVLRSQPANIELLVIGRAQSPQLRQPANMSTHGEMMDAMYLRRLLDAQKRRSSEILKRQANPSSE
jgi:hypothetical protein